MTIEIHRPELEALIRERMEEGAFQSIEDALLDALKTSTHPEETCAETGRTGADLVAALQSSPHKEIDLETARHPLPVREIEF